MSKRTYLKRTGLLIVTALAGLAIYEGYRVSKAASAAEAKFESILSQAKIKASDLSPEQRRILLTVQDPGFENHKGVDLSTPGGGLTTLTQSLTKRVFFDDFKPGFAKIEQTLIARYVVHPKISKDDQITAFLNLAYFGRCQNQQITGYSDAAQCYLDKPFEQLTDADFINLTARLIAPNKYNRDAEALDDRIGKIGTLLAGNCQPDGLRDVRYSLC